MAIDEFRLGVDRYFGGQGPLKRVLAPFSTRMLTAVVERARSVQDRMRGLLKGNRRCNTVSMILSTFHLEWISCSLKS